MNNETAGASTLRILLADDEYWWGGQVNDGVLMPFGAASEYRCDLRQSNGGNQAVPLLASSRGRFVWCDRAFTFEFDRGMLFVASAPGSPATLAEGYGNLPGAFRAAREKYFPPSGRMPGALNFSAPQYNCWIEMQYQPTQEKMLRYAREILDHGLPPGVLMIDDNWFENHGDWQFHPGRFPDPAAMIRQLREWGFQVMLWVSPFISADSIVYRNLAARGLLVRDAETDKPVVREWWNGQSALLDVTHPDAIAWQHQALRRLMDKAGVDGFKFDAGDPDYFRLGDRTYRPIDPVGYSEAWGRVGLQYALNEYRACWKLAGQALVQRLRDKRHTWGRDGLADLVPNGLAQSLAGYAFTCPDMVGGGDIGSFTNPDFKPDQELFVRTMQASALFPILQFSIAPWRVLDSEHWNYCYGAVQVRQELAPYILEQARLAAQTGEPMMRPLAYNYPDGGFETVTDQFLLGDNILVAPVIEKSAVSRTIAFPAGDWRDEKGTVIHGPCSIEVDAPLSRLPWYRKC